MKQVHEILTGSDFAEFSDNNGHYDHRSYTLAIQNGDGWAIRSIYDSLAACANGIDYCGNGSTYRARQEAAKRCMDDWPMARVAVPRAGDPIRREPVMVLHIN